MRAPRLSLLALSIAATDAFAQTTTASPAPDYSNPQAWLCRPDHPGACDVDLSTTVVAQDGRATVERAFTWERCGQATIAGRRARTYEIDYTREGERLVDKVAFILEGRREFQLTCRIRVEEPDAGTEACDRLRSSFRLT